MSRALPEYAFVPGGPFRHPKTDAEPDPLPQPIREGNWRDSPTYAHGFDLFNGGYYWEAHEVWEGLWHAHGRRGPIADLLKGLIKLAAAGVKVRQGQRHGIMTHATRAADCFAAARSAAGRDLLGLDLVRLEEISRRVVEDPPSFGVDLAARVARVFDFPLAPDGFAAGCLER